MKTKSLFIAAFFLTLIARAADPTWRYQLLEGSFLTDDCLICGRPSINNPMRGSFFIRRVEVSPVATRYVIENADFKAGPDYHFTGSGTYTISGDFVLKQSMTLTGALQTASETKQVGFTNQTTAITRRWPMLFATLTQTNGTLASTITLTIAAAPLQEIWFSTSTNFTRAIKIDNTVSDGDLLSTIGHIVKRNSDFQTNFPGPTFLDMGLDAVDLLPGAEIAFSTETKGVLSDGDFAFANTGAITHWQDFMNIVAPDLASDPGLDALQFDGPTKIYFSTKQDISGAVGPIGNGDILFIDTEAGTGDIFRSNADLLSQFHPAESKDYGLDALYIWPSGEIWFSTANDFSDSQLGPITAGDLLSDAGYIVYRNADLTSALMPLGDPPTDFGLDALVVISDFVPDESKTSLKAFRDPQNDAVILSWQGDARAFRLERARDITGPWEAITSIVPAFTFEDTDNISQQQRAFYRIRQW